MVNAAIRPRRRFAKRQFVRPRRRKIRKDTWAFVPSGGMLESRLRRLLSCSAENVVRNQLAAQEAMSKIDRSEDVAGTQNNNQEEELDLSPMMNVGVVGVSGDDFSFAAKEEEQVDGLVAGVEDSSSRGRSVEQVLDAEGVHVISQELPHFSSQMSEGLEILLLASQEGLRVDEPELARICPRKEHATGRFWQELHDVCDVTDIAANKI